MDVSFTVSDNSLWGSIHLCNRLPRMLILNLEATFNGCWNQLYKIQVLTLKIWILMRLAWSLVEIWEIRGCQGGAPQLWMGPRTCTSTSIYWAKQALDGERTNRHRKPLQAPIWASGYPGFLFWLTYSLTVWPWARCFPWQPWLPPWENEAAESYKP